MSDITQALTEARANWPDSERSARSMMKSLGAALIERANDPAWTIGAMFQLIERNKDLIVAEMYRDESRPVGTEHKQN